MENIAPRVLLIEGSDFESFPAGGILSMVRSLMKLFGNCFALVGMSQPGTPVGRWIRKDINGISYLFFSTCIRNASAKRPLIPDRLKFFSALKFYKKEILSLGCKDVFTQSAEALLAISKWDLHTLSFDFAGTENPLSVSRYWYAKPLSHLFDRLFFNLFRKEITVFVTADKSAFSNLQLRSKGRLSPERMFQLPTCVDTSEFSPIPIPEARAQLGIRADQTVFVNHGRIGRFKGWNLLLDSFREYLRKHGDGLLFFVGDGEDRAVLQSRIDALNLDFCVKITGFRSPSQICTYLNAANAALFASFAEGWSTAMLEALACGKPIVCTRVSGASTMIISGQNGYILDSRDTASFVMAMERAVQLPHAHTVSAAIAAEFDLFHLGKRLADLWPPLRDRATLAIGGCGSNITESRSLFAELRSESNG